MAFGLVPDCFECRNLVGVNPAGGWMCRAFDHIPVDILSRRVDHRSPREGDGGVRFELGEPKQVSRQDDASFRETDHPRDGDGKFTSGGGSSGGGSPTETKPLAVDIGGANYTIDVVDGRPVKIVWHKDAGGGKTEDVVEWTPDLDDPPSGVGKILEQARRQLPGEIADPEMPAIDISNITDLSNGNLINAQRELRDYKEHLLDTEQFDADTFKQISKVRGLVTDELARREALKAQSSVEKRRSEPSGDAKLVVETKPEFGKVDEKDPLWYISPHGVQPILESARAAGYSEATIKMVLGALKQQGWSASSEAGAEGSELRKIATGQYGDAERDLLRAVGQREARAPEVTSRDYYRKGSFSGQPVLSTTRNESGAAMAVGVGQFVNIGWDEKKTGKDLLAAGYLPFGETFTQGYGEEAETLWIKFPDRADRQDESQRGESRGAEIHPNLRAAGVMFVDDTGHVLLLRRSDTGEWAFPGGGIEEGETEEEAARRECEEEIGRRPGELTEWTRRIADGVDFTTFMARIPERFEPELNDEHTDHRWDVLGDLEGASLDHVLGRSDDANFRETEHPRDGDGKFTAGAGGSSSSKIGGLKIKNIVEQLKLFKESKKRTELTEELVRQIAKQNGITKLPNIVAKTEEKYTFKLGDRTATAGGTYDPKTDTVTIYPNELSPESFPSIIAHELMHHKFSKVIDEFKAERARLFQEKDLGKIMAPDDTIRAEYRKEYPYYSSLDKLLNVEKLEKDDGCSDYSREWWSARATDPGIDPWIPINETLAEMANYEQDGILDRLLWYKQAKVWKQLYSNINKLYETNHA